MTARIVVGVDGSPGSLDALRWAGGEAARRHAVLDVVLAYSRPRDEFPPLYATPSEPELHAAARRRLDAIIEREAIGHVDVEVRPHAVAGRPATVLKRVAEGGDLLVVGARGLGELEGVVLGSVSQRCATGAPCPVVVVPHGFGSPTPS
jgi:nucleotide-binding universal stress UspA family protein